MGVPDLAGEGEIWGRTPSQNMQLLPNYLPICFRFTTKDGLYDAPGGSIDQRFCLIPNYFGTQQPTWGGGTKGSNVNRGTQPPT